jgi:hypothetical protein
MEAVKCQCTIQCQASLALYELTRPMITLPNFHRCFDGANIAEMRTSTASTSEKPPNDELANSSLTESVQGIQRFCPDFANEAAIACRLASSSALHDRLGDMVNLGVIFASGVVGQAYSVQLTVVVICEVSRELGSI